MNWLVFCCCVLLAELGVVCHAEYIVHLPSVWRRNYDHLIPAYVSLTPATIVLSLPDHGINRQFPIKSRFTELHLNLSTSTKRFQSAETLLLQIWECVSVSQCARPALNRTFRIAIEDESVHFDLFLSRSIYRSGDKVSVLITFYTLEQNSRDFSSYNYSDLRHSFRVQMLDSTLDTVIERQLMPTGSVELLQLALPGNASSGNWKIVVQHNNNKAKTKTFRVVHRFRKQSQIGLRLSVLWHGSVTVNSRTVAVSICAFYSPVRTLVGTVSGRVCLLSSLDGFEVEQKCIDLQRNMNGSSLCLEHDIDFKQLLVDNQLDKMRLLLQLQATDRHSLISISKTFNGPEVQLYEYKIMFESASFYKPGLPYYGRIRLQRHDGTAHGGAPVFIQCNTVNFPHDWGHYSSHQSRSVDGVVEFVLTPPPPSLQAITCDIEDHASARNSSRTDKAFRPYLTKILEKWQSDGDFQIQAVPTILINGVLDLRVQLNRRLAVAEDFMAVLLEDGRVLQSEMVRLEELPCQDRDDELGHYQCEEGTRRLLCNAGWSGRDCLTPLCAIRGCNSGLCVAPDKCLCKYGWRRDGCDKCVRNKNCMHGICVHGNDCVCNPGWMGNDCDIAVPSSSSSEQRSYHRRRRAAAAVASSRESSGRSSQEQGIVRMHARLTVPSSWSGVAAMTVLLHSVRDHLVSTSLTVPPPLRSSNDSSQIPNRIQGYNISSSEKCVLLDSEMAEAVVAARAQAYQQGSTSTQAAQALYGTVIAAECTVPKFDAIFVKHASQRASSLGLYQQRERHYDMLAGLQQLGLFPVSSSRTVSRSCPMWRLLEIFKSVASVPPEAPSSGGRYGTLSSTPTWKDDDDSDQSTRFRHWPLLVDSAAHRQHRLCPHDRDSGPLYVRYRPPVTLSLSPYLSPDGGHLMLGESIQLRISLHSVWEPSGSSLLLLQLHFPREQEHCLIEPNDSHRLFQARLLHPTAAGPVAVTSRLGFRCTGAFTGHLNLFAGNSSSSGLEPLATEPLHFRVHQGIRNFQDKTIFYCGSQTLSSRKELILPLLFPGRDNSDLELSVHSRSSLEHFLVFVQYTQQQWTASTLMHMLQEIYLIQLRRLINPRASVNKSLNSIRSYLRLELSQQRGQQQQQQQVDLFPENRTLLRLVACTKMPVYYYSAKRRYCDSVAHTLQTRRIISNNCFAYPNHTKTSWMLLVLANRVPLRFSSYRISATKDLLYFQACCRKLGYHDFAALNFSSNQSLANWVDATPKTDEEFLVAYMLVSKFAFTQNRNAIILKIVRKFVEKIVQMNLRLNDVKTVFLLQMFYEFESYNSLPNRILISRYHYNHYTKIPDNLKLSIDNPIGSGCQITTVKCWYFQSNSKLHRTDLTVSSVNNTAYFELNVDSFVTSRIVLPYPSSWRMSTSHHRNLFHFCHLIQTYNIDKSILTVDLRMIPENCTRMMTLKFTLIKYQQIFNVQHQFIIFMMKNNTKQYQKLKIVESPPKTEIQKQKNTTAHIFNMACKNNTQIVVHLNKTRIVIFDETKILYYYESTKDSKLKFVSSAKEFFNVKLNEAIMWIIKNTQCNICNRLITLKGILLEQTNFSNVSPCFIMNKNDLETDIDLQRLVCAQHAHIYHHTVKGEWESVPLKLCKGYPKINLVSKAVEKYNCTKSSVLSNNIIKLFSKAVT